MKDPGVDVFAERLRTVRNSIEMTQSQLALIAGLKPSAISHFETGRRAPSIQNLRRISHALCITTDYLLGRVGAEKWFIRREL
jgi:transcriptional regulator with XRE-family HTH domain